MARQRNRSEEPGRSRLRCAIYTRKSTEEGLDQEFNSLDAQREACTAYIVSQRHEGWTLSPECYDDGGFSGGNMDRPGLAQLLADVKAGRVDVIVVYKVDRLTRSLADFAKIVDVLDEAEASFVSVTQAFNTTTSMGRLTLNVLLSFAQFEREVTGERIRDKIAASKAKGMWMGGTVPMGYEVKDRKLCIRDDEADTVRHIFKRYLELGSVPTLADELEDAGIRTRQRISRTGRSYGGTKLSKGALYGMLQNRIYVGDVVHKGKAYSGEHDAIVDAKLFSGVQARLEANQITRKNGDHAKAPSLLTGLVSDSFGRGMSPSHACKQGLRYRYYTSRRDDSEARAHPVWRVPAVDLEEIVIGQLCALLRDRETLSKHCISDPEALLQLFDRARQQADFLESATPQEKSAVLRELIKQVVIHEERITITTSLASIMHEPAEAQEATIELEVAARIGRAGKRTRIAIPPAAMHNRFRDPALIRLVAKAHAARQAVEACNEDIKAIARTQGYDGDYFARLVRLGYLAPDIITAILDGRQPATLTRQRLARVSKLPIDWAEQSQLLGFA